MMTQRRSPSLVWIGFPPTLLEQRNKSPGVCCFVFWIPFAPISVCVVVIRNLSCSALSCVSFDLGSSYTTMILLASREKLPHRSSSLVVLSTCWAPQKALAMQAQDELGLIPAPSLLTARIAVSVFIPGF